MNTPRTIGLVIAVATLSLTACAPQPQAAPSPDDVDTATGLEGEYSVTWTPDELFERLGGDENPEARDIAEGNAGELRLTFDDDGTYGFVYVSDGSSCPGTYEVDGDRVVMTATTDPTLWDCGDGLGQLAADARWITDGDTLTLTEWELSPEPAMDWVYAAFFEDAPLTRVE